MVVGVLAILIKKTILFIVPPLLSFTICFTIGFIDSKNLVLYPILTNSSAMLSFAFGGLALIILIIVFRIIIIKTKRKRLKYLSIGLLVVVYFFAILLTLSICVTNLFGYHASQTNDLNNYLICDDVSVSNEAKEYFPEKENFEKYNAYYSYYYEIMPFDETTFDIQLIIEYQDDYEEMKEAIISKYLDIFENNQIVVKEYKRYNNHYRKIIIKLDDDNRTVEYKFSDHLPDD